MINGTHVDDRARYRPSTSAAWVLLLSAAQLEGRMLYLSAEASSGLCLPP
jgi:hypothetical protein